MTYQVRNSTNVPLFAGVESADDMFIVSMEEFYKEAESEIAPFSPLWDYLKSNNLIEYVGDMSTDVEVPILTKKNTTAKFVSGYDDADNTPQDALENARFTSGFLHGTQMYNRQEMLQNTGSTKRMDLVETKHQQLIESLQEVFIDDVLMGTQDADGKKPTGLMRIVEPSTTLGGLDPAVATYWAPTITFKTGSTKFALASEFRAGMRKFQRALWVAGRKMWPDVYMLGEDVYEEQQKWMESVLQVRIEDLKKKSGFGDHEMFTYMGNTYIYEPALAAKIVKAFNFRKYVKVQIHKGTNFQFDNWEIMEGKAMAKKRNNLTMMRIVCKRRSPNGSIEFS